MTLIGILVAILFERLLGQWPGWGQPRLLPWLLREVPRRLPLGRLWQSPLILLLWWVLPVVLVHQLLAGIPDPIVALLLSALVLLLCLGPRDLADDIRRLHAAREAGDAHAERQLLQALRSDLPAEEPHYQSLRAALFIQSHERLFGVLLAYLAFGAAGALAYRLASGLPRFLLIEQGESPAQRWALRLHETLAWVPARLTALLFGLAGSLDHALKAWREIHNAPAGETSRTWRLLGEVAAAAVLREEDDGRTGLPPGLDACVDEVVRMQWRALLILLAVFAVTTTSTLL